MNRYYLIHLDHMPGPEDNYGNQHWLSVGSHGPTGEGWHVLCLQDGHVRPHADWIAFPPLIDSKTTLAQSRVPHELLADLGLTGEETCLEAIVKLGEINPAMNLFD
jgi:hypothetical protein